MAERPIFVPAATGPAFVRTQSIAFQWFPGMAVTQKQRSIASLHAAAVAIAGIGSVLEVSSKSPDQLGVALSAFNLTFVTARQRRRLSVECAYQGSKVFEQGGPYVDIFEKSSRAAKTDLRLQSSGRLIGFQFFGVRWGLEPQTAFYDWLYINALVKQPGLGREVQGYSAFTDIEFNPTQSLNCQAYSVALFVAFARRNMLEEAMSSKDAFLRVVRSAVISSAREDETVQGRLLLE